MRRSLRLFAAAATALAFAGTAQAQSLSVRMDQGTRVALPGVARDVVVGNPTIADVSVIDGRNLLVLGKRHGVTNLVVIDDRGRTILDRQIMVSGGDTGQVTYFRGAGAPRSFTCAPSCELTDQAEAAAAPGAGGE